MRDLRGLFGALVLLAGCSGDTDTVETDEPVDTEDTEDTDVVDTDIIDTDAPTRGDLLILPFDAVVRVGEPLPMRARAVMSDGSLPSVTSGLTWGTTSGATIDATGVLVAGASGAGVRVHVAADALQTSALVRVASSEATIEQIRLIPGTPVTRLGTDVVLSAFAELSDGSFGDFGGSCTWASLEPTVATVGAAGVVTPLAPGKAEIQATCEDWIVSTLVFVDPNEVAPDLVIQELRTTALGGAEVRYEALVANAGATSPAFAVDVYPNAEVSGPGRGEPTIVVPGLAQGQSRWVTLSAPYAGERPATLASWAVVDAAARIAETRDDNNAIGPVPLELPGDASADLQVDFTFAAVFGPYETGVEIAVTNLGPSDLFDVVVAFERDQPGVVDIGELDPLAAERTETIASLPSGESYAWVFTYEDAPIGTTWWSCAFVTSEGFVDPTPDDNFDCFELTE